MQGVGRRYMYPLKQMEEQCVCNHIHPTSPQQRLPLHIAFVCRRRLTRSDRPPTPNCQHPTRTRDDISVRPIARHIPEDVLQLRLDMLAAKKYQSHRKYHDDYEYHAKYSTHLPQRIERFCLVIPILLRLDFGSDHPIELRDDTGHETIVVAAREKEPEFVVLEADLSIVRDDGDDCIYTSMSCQFQETLVVPEAVGVDVRTNCSRSLSSLNGLSFSKPQELWPRFSGRMLSTFLRAILCQRHSRLVDVWQGY